MTRKTNSYKVNLLGKSDAEILIMNIVSHDFHLAEKIIDTIKEPRDQSKVLVQMKVNNIEIDAKIFFAALIDTFNRALVSKNENLEKKEAALEHLKEDIAREGLKTVMGWSIEEVQSNIGKAIMDTLIEEKLDND